MNFAKILLYSAGTAREHKHRRSSADGNCRARWSCDGADLEVLHERSNRVLPQIEGQRRKFVGRFTFLFRYFVSTQFFDSAGTAKDEPDDPISNFIGTIERVLMKYDIDATACTQKLLCDSIKSASQSVTMGKGSSSEKIFDGVMRCAHFSAILFRSDLTTFHFQFLLAAAGDCRHRNPRCVSGR